MHPLELSILIVHYNTPDLLRPMFEHLFQALSLPDGSKIPHEIIVVDNASKLSCEALVTQCAPNAKFIQNTSNVGFGRANNQVLAQSSGRFVLLLNTDAFIAKDSLHKTLAFMNAQARCGVLGVKLIGRDGSLQPSCRYFPTPLNSFLQRTGLAGFFPSVQLTDNMQWDHAGVRECDWVPGCFYLIRRALIDQVGLFDSRYFMYFEEVDHCKLAKAAGWQVMYFGDTSAVHLGGESAKTEHAVTKHGAQISELQLESELLYFRKHYGLVGVLLHLALGAIAATAAGAKRLVFKSPQAGNRSRFKNALSSFGDAKRSWRAFASTSYATVPSR